MMKYMPRVASTHQMGAAPFGPKHQVRFFDQIQSVGAIQYKFILGVFDKVTGEPIFFVASEVNAMADSSGSDSHFLGVFDGNGHANYGASRDWADAPKFFARALEIAAGRFGAPPLNSNFDQPKS